MHSLPPGSDENAVHIDSQAALLARVAALIDDAPQAPRRQGIDGASRVAHAICDQRGVLHSAEPRFVELLQEEWPDWRGPSLPTALQRQSTALEYHGDRIALRCFNACGFTLMEVRPVSALDSLSPRERTIAAAFGEGRSYKQIAAQLGLSPATVRHHPRSIYAKTNISNKGALAGLLR